MSFTAWDDVVNSDKWKDGGYQYRRDTMSSYMDYYRDNGNPDSVPYAEKAFELQFKALDESFPDYAKGDEGYENKQAKIKAGLDLVDDWDLSLQGNTKKVSAPVDTGIDGTFSEGGQVQVVENTEALEARVRRDAKIKELGLDWDQAKTLVEDAKLSLWQSDQTEDRNYSIDSDGMIQVNPRAALLPEDVASLKKDIDESSALDTEKRFAKNRVDALHKMQGEELEKKFNSLHKNTQDAYKLQNNAWGRAYREKVFGYADFELGIQGRKNAKVREGMSEREAIYEVIREEDTLNRSLDSALESFEGDVEKVPQALKFMVTGENSNVSKVLAERDALLGEMRSGVSGANSFAFDLTKGGLQAGAQVGLGLATGGAGGVALSAVTAGVQSGSLKVNELANDPELMRQLESGEITHDEYVSKVRNTSAKVAGFTSLTTLGFNKGVESLAKVGVRKAVSKEITKDLLEGFGKKNSSLVARAFKGGVTGGSEEVVEETLQNAYEFYETAKVKGEDPNWSEFATDMPRTALISFILGGGANSLTSISEGGNFNPERAKQVIAELQGRARSGENIFNEAGQGENAARFADDPLSDESVKAFARATGVSEVDARRELSDTLRVASEATTTEAQSPLVSKSLSELETIANDGNQNLIDGITLDDIEAIGSRKKIEDFKANPSAIKDLGNEKPNTTEGTSIESSETEGSINDNAAGVEEANTNEGVLEATPGEGIDGEGSKVGLQRRAKQAQGETKASDDNTESGQSANADALNDDIQQRDTVTDRRVGEAVEGGVTPTTQEVDATQADPESEVSKDDGGARTSGEVGAEVVLDKDPELITNLNNENNSDIQTERSEGVARERSQIQGGKNTPSERISREIKKGSESTVFESKDGRTVIKKLDAGGVVTDTVDGKVIRSNDRADIQLKVDTINRFNGAETVLLEEDGQFYIEQEKGDPITQEEFESIQLSNGFRPSEGGFFRIENGGKALKVSDLHIGNFIKTQDGEIRAIDLVVGDFDSTNTFGDFDTNDLLESPVAREPLSKRNENSKKAAPIKASQVQVGDEIKVDKGGRAPTTEKVKTITKSSDGSLTIDFISPTSIKVNPEDDVSGVISVNRSNTGTLGFPSNSNLRPVINSPTHDPVPTGAPEVMDRLTDIMASVESVTPIRVRAPRSRSSIGEFEVRSEVIRLRQANDIPTASHEVAHDLEKHIIPTLKKSFTKGMKDELTTLGKNLYPDKVPNGGWVSEGFAEFVRFYLSSDSDIKTKAPEFHKWFENDFLNSRPKTKEAIEKAREKILDFNSQTAKERATQSIVGNERLGRKVESLSKNVKGQLRAATELMVESGLAFKEIDNQIERETGKHADIYSSFKATRKTADSVVGYMISKGMVDFNGNIVGKSLDEVFKPVRGKGGDFTLYLWAKRAIALHDEGLGRNPGLSREDAIQIVSDLDSPEFQIASSELYQWQDNVLQYMADSSPDISRAVGQIREVDPGNYIPLKREFDALEKSYNKVANENSAAVSKRLRGSGRRIKDPVESIIGDTAQKVRASHNRYILEKVISMAENVEGIGNHIVEIPANVVPKAQRDVEDLLKQITKRVEGSGGSVAVDDGGLDLSSEILSFYGGANPTEKENRIIPVVRDGKVKYFEISNELSKSLEAMHPRDMGNLERVLGSVFRSSAKLFRLGTTGLRASFSLVTNPLRDVQTLYINSRYLDNPAVVLSEYLREYALGAVHAFTGGKFTTEWQDAFDRFGGALSTPLGQDSSPVKRSARQLGQSIGMRVVDPRNAFDYVSEILQFPEKAARIVEMKESAKKVGWDGESPITRQQVEQILLDAKEVTTDFTASGSLASAINQYIPFFNAGIQGKRSHIRLAKERPAAFFAKGATLMALSLATWWKNKDEEWWEEMTSDERYRSTFVQLKDDTIIRIPRSFEVGGLFMALPEALFDSAYQYYKEDPEDRKYILDWMDSFINHSKPISLNPLNDNPVTSLIRDVDTNKDQFFDRPIVPRRLEGLPKEEQFNEYTSRAAIAIGEVTGESPMIIEHAVRKIGGSVGGDILGIFGRGDVPDQERDNSGLPIIGTAFLRDSMPSQSISVKKFYENLTSATQKQRSKKNPETPQERNSRLLISDAKKAMTALFEAKKNAKKPKERSKLHKEINSIARDANKAYKAGEGRPPNR